MPTKTLYETAVCIYMYIHVLETPHKYPLRSNKIPFPYFTQYSLGKRPGKIDIYTNLLSVEKTQSAVSFLLY